ncbi:MAG: T9SS type A sorting domain-containing protein [Bacteroidota bacterium]
MKTIILLFNSLFLAVMVEAQIIRIPEDQPTIQDGINAAASGDTVLVSDGIYFENISFAGNDITVASNFIMDHDFNHINHTIIDGSQPADPDSASVVTFCSGEDVFSVLDGFTIIHGAGTFVTEDNETAGGGIYCLNAGPLLRHLIVKNNQSWSGSGIYCNNSVVKIVEVTIKDNSWTEVGGGLCLLGGYPCLKNVRIMNNFGDWGGGVYLDSGGADFINVMITDNTGGYGGGMLCISGSPNYINTTIANNTAYFGGGLECFAGSHPVLVNSILWNNSPEQVNFLGDYDPNSITISWSDIQGGLAGIVTNNNATVNWLDGNLDLFPQFAGDGEDPLSLTETSPCIDTGTPDTTGLNLPDGDLLGNFRMWDGDGDGMARVDMGAYEYGAVTLGSERHPAAFFPLQLTIYPNPFRSGTTIEYQLNKNTSVTLTIYNQLGQAIKILVNELHAKGLHRLKWNAKSLPSGIYFCLLSYENQRISGKFIKTD